MTSVVRPRHIRVTRLAQPRRAPWIALILLLALGITVVGIFPFRQIITQHRQVDLTYAKLSALESANSRLGNQINLLHTDVELERLAREQFGVVRSGETVYTVSIPDEDPVGQVLHSRPIATEENFEDRGFFRRVWDFLTGRDLAHDG